LEQGLSQGEKKELTINCEECFDGRYCYSEGVALPSAFYTLSLESLSSNYSCFQATSFIEFVFIKLFLATLQVYAESMKIIIKFNTL
jgi:hypothetical protein